jgi:putative membrane protein
MNRIPFRPALGSLAAAALAAFALHVAAQTGSTTGSSSASPAMGGTAATAPSTNVAAPASAGKTTLDSFERHFVEDAAAGGQYEVAAGRLAQEKGGSQAVKDFGGMLVTDHSKASDELKALATSKGMTLPDKLPHAKRSELDKLGKLSGEKFDEKFSKEAVKDHEKDIKKFEEASKKAKDPELKAWADKTLPTLRTHLDHAKAVAGKKG